MVTTNTLKCKYVRVRCEEKQAANERHASSDICLRRGPLRARRPCGARK